MAPGTTQGASDVGMAAAVSELRPAPRTRISRIAAQRQRSAPITEGDASPDTLERESCYRRALALADVASALTALAVALHLPGDESLRSALIVPLIVALNKASGLYDRDELVLTKTTLDELPGLVKNAGVFTLLAWLFYQWLHPVPLTAYQIMLVWGLTSGLLLLTRAAARNVAARVSQPERCLIAGDPASLETLAAKVNRAGLRVDVVGQLPLHPHASEAESPDQRKLLRQYRVQRLLMAPVTPDASDSLDLIRTAKALGVRVSVIPRLFEVVGSSVEFDQIDGLTVLGIRRFGLTRSSRLVKRTFDLAVASVALVAMAPIMAVIAIAIRLDSKGPILFRQVRAGREGVPFEMLKFRSMVPDAEQLKGQLSHLNEARNGMFKIAADPRVTRVGRFCRRTSLDELPQLFNVLRGEMSLVGPRPLVLDEDARVTGYARARLQLTPGMTGHWQILGSARIPMDEMLGIDYLYVANWSLWSDVKILLRTVPYVLAQRSM
jgi:exopolysaccharide biosynthesis polyprenyl glycosylphosphotransferase